MGAQRITAVAAGWQTASSDAYSLQPLRTHRRLTSDEGVNMTYGGEAMERAEMCARLEREGRGAARGLSLALWLGIGAAALVGWLL